ncbi:MAG: hypothetical protein DI586_03500 [Micavibrio aeruginosavorus]|uniref:Uncharacterized protein n=1 Tax=Micavibrio aeruginosavorus TaxID=349221 RepID=A0A2W5HS11_9BACT|nr:MAG: hypothetical protein DI586_03500 [Micavibrio aeruginosavorus]
MKEILSQKALLASSVTIGLVIVLIFAKTVAYVFSGSASVLSSLVDSISDIGMSLMTWLSIRWSLKPADEDHRHGHGKIEGVSALFQAAVLTGSAVFLLFTAIDRFIEPQKMTDHLYALMLMFLSVLMSLVMTYVQNQAQKETGSLALEADKAHYSTDVWMNGAVMIVVFFDYMKWAPMWLDTAATALIAALFAKTAYCIAVKALDMLMDREVEPETKARIFKIVTSPQEVKGVHDLRVTRSGMKMFVSFDMEVDANLLLWSAHEIAQEAEYRILKEFPNAEILIHLDPEGDTDDTRHGEVTA